MAHVIGDEDDYLQRMVKWLMQKKRLSQAEVGRRAGLSRQQVSDYLASRRSLPDDVIDAMDWWVAEEEGQLNESERIEMEDSLDE